MTPGFLVVALRSQPAKIKRPWTADYRRHLTGYRPTFQAELV